jgi:NAD(P)H-hydrate repair Nnr-like enzyme with NAD(P)H-hydrate dehydratase domain
LTGILLALLAQDYSSHDAALLAVYVHGLAGDIAADKWGMTAMTAMSIVRALPQAWKQIER